jgi:hypothetical protein
MAGTDAVLVVRCAKRAAERLRAQARVDYIESEELGSKPGAGAKAFQSNMRGAAALALEELARELQMTIAPKPTREGES